MIPYDHVETPFHTGLLHHVIINGAKCPISSEVKTRARTVSLETVRGRPWSQRARLHYLVMRFPSLPEGKGGAGRALGTLMTV